MRFDALTTVFELNKRRADFERRLKEGLVNPQEVEPIALTSTDTLIALYLARRANDTTALAFPSLATIAAECRLNRSTVRRILKKLGDLGVIERVKEGRGQRPDTYRVILGVGTLDTSSVRTVQPLDVVVENPEGALMTPRGCFDDTQGVHSASQYKKDTNIETTGTPRRRTAGVEPKVTEAYDAIQKFYLTGTPRDRQSLPPLAQTLLDEMSESTVGQMSDYDCKTKLRLLAKNAGASRLAQKPTPEPGPPVDDNDRNAALFAEIEAQKADARSRQTTVEPRNPEGTARSCRLRNDDSREAMSDRPEIFQPSWEDQASLRNQLSAGFKCP